MRIHVVESGDTLYGIAKKYGITLEQLRRLNPDTAVLHIGQELRIDTGDTPTTTSTAPTAPTAETYTVKTGDSFYRISRHFSISIEALRKYNGLESYLLQVGQVLRIPAPEAETPPPASKPTEPPPAPPPEQVHTVVSGDSLYQLARRYNVTINDIRQANQLDSNLLSIGQQLVIPRPDNTRQAHEEHFVKSGDTLGRISKRYDVSLEALRAFNRLESDSIYVGQLLYIPPEDYTAEEDISWDSKVTLPSPDELTAIKAQRRATFQLDFQNGVAIFGDGLTGGVGPEQENAPEDVQKVRQRLAQLKLLDQETDGAEDLWRAIQVFQQRYRVAWWATHKVWGIQKSSFTEKAVQPNDMTYRLLREHTRYYLSFEDHRGEIREARFTNFPRSRYTVYPYGVSYVGTARHRIKASYFHRLGISRILAEALDFVSSNEGNFDAINSYDRAIFSFGFIQFAGQTVNGTLPQLLAFIKKHDEDLFRRTFRRFGIDVEYAEAQKNVFRPARLVVIDPEAEQGLVVLRGREAEEHIRASKLLHGVFIRAGHDPEIAKLQVRAALHFYIRPAVGSRIVLDIGQRKDLGTESIRDILRSSAGLATLLDLTIHRGLSAAIKLLEEAIEAVSEQHGLSTIWQIRNIDERKILRYLRRNHADPLLKRRIGKILDLVGKEQHKPLEEQRLSFFKRY